MRQHLSKSDTGGAAQLKANSAEAHSATLVIGVQENSDGQSAGKSSGESGPNYGADNPGDGNREIMDIRAAARYLGISRSHLSHILAGKVAGVPAIPHVRAGRRALIRRGVIDRWLSEREQRQSLGA